MFYHFISIPSSIHCHIKFISSTLKFHLSSYSSPLQSVKAKPSVCVSGDAAIPRRCGMSGLWPHQSVLLFTTPQAAHTPLVSSQACKCPEAASASAPIAQKVHYICGLWFPLPIREEHFTLFSCLTIKVGKGELITRLKPPICEDFRPRHEELVLHLKLLLTGTQPQALPGTALRMCRLNTFSALSLIISLSLFWWFCVGGNTNKVKLWPFLLHPCSPCLFFPIPYLNLDVLRSVPLSKTQECPFEKLSGDAWTPGYRSFWLATEV